MDGIIDISIWQMAISFVYVVAVVLIVLMIGIPREVQIVVSSLRLPRRYLTVMMGVWGVSTLPFAIVGVTHEYWLMAVCLFLVGFGFSYGNVIWGTLLQRRVPRHMLGRISSLDFFVSLALMPLSMALAGPLAEVIPVEAIFIAAGVIPLFLGAVAYAAARMPKDEIAHPLDH